MRTREHDAFRVPILQDKGTDILVTGDAELFVGIRNVLRVDPHLILQKGPIKLRALLLHQRLKLIPIFVFHHDWEGKPFLLCQLVKLHVQPAVVFHNLDRELSQLIGGSALDSCLAVREVGNTAPRILESKMSGPFLSDPRSALASSFVHARAPPKEVLSVRRSQFSLYP